MAGSVEEAISRLEREQTISKLLTTACRDLAELLGADNVAVSRTIGDLLVELAHHTRSGRPAPLELFLVSDYPLTREVLERGEPRAASLADPDADEAESALLRRLGYQALLMLPLVSNGRNWGLVEAHVFGGELREASAEASAIVAALGRRLAELEA